MRSIHAEENAIYRALYKELNMRGADLYSTRAPCAQCATRIVEAGIQKVFYAEEYRDPLGINLLSQGGVEVYRITPNGWILDTGGNLVEPDTIP